MKISSTPPVSQVVAVPDESTTETATTAKASAEFVAAVREGIRPASLRQDKVDEVKQQLQSGTFEESVDLDAVVERLISDL